MSTVKLISNGVEHTREAFISYPAQLPVIRRKSRQPGGLLFHAGFNNPMSNKVASRDASYVVMSGRCPSYVPHRSYDPVIRSILYNGRRDIVRTNIPVRINAPAGAGKTGKLNTGYGYAVNAVIRDESRLPVLPLKKVYDYNIAVAKGTYEIVAE